MPSRPSTSTGLTRWRKRAVHKVSSSSLKSLFGDMTHACATVPWGPSSFTDHLNKGGGEEFEWDATRLCVYRRMQQMPIGDNLLAAKSMTSAPLAAHGPPRPPSARKSGDSPRALGLSSGESSGCVANWTEQTQTYERGARSSTMLVTRSIRVVDTAMFRRVATGWREISRM